MDEIGPGDGGSVDDRGGAIERRTLRALGASGDDGGKGRRAAVRLVKQAIGYEATRISVANVSLTIALALLWVVGCCGMLVTSPFPRRLGPWPFLVVLGGSLWLMGRLVRWTAMRRVERNIAPTLVAGGFCGACGYSLAGLIAEGDGCVVCPECGAAWREARLGRSEARSLGTGASCGACGYSLAGLNAGGDGGVVCPECGTAWLDSRGTGGLGPSWMVRFATLTPSRRNLITPDDRGSLVHTVDRRLMWVSPGRRMSLGAERTRELRRELGGMGEDGRLVLAVIAWLVPVAWLIGVVNGWSRWSSIPSDEFFFVLFVLTFSVILTVVWLRSHAFYNRGAAARALVNAGHCGSCLAPLDGLLPESDGRVTCPDCAAGWVPRRAGAGTGGAARGDGNAA